MAAPAAPANLRLSTYDTGDGRIKTILRWDSGSVANGVFAKLESCTGTSCSGFSQFDTAPASFYSVNALESQYIDGVLRTLSAATVYRYRVRNERNGEFSSYSNEIEITTIGTPAAPPSGVDTSVPQSPTDLTATSGGATSINLAWTDNATNETGYLVERRRSTGTDLQWYNITTTAANAVSYGDTGLESQTNYIYRVRAYNLYGYSFYSNEADATTSSTTPAGLTAPSLTSATLENLATDPQIKLIWTDNATTETAYYIERSATDSAAGFTVIFIAGANTLTYTDPTVFYGVTYTYRVRAYRSGDGLYSPYSLTKTVTVPINPDSGTSSLGINYGIRQFSSGDSSDGAIIKDNDMGNNGLGDLETSVIQTPGVTIDNPQASNLLIRRGITIYS